MNKPSTPKDLRFGSILCAAVAAITEIVAVLIHYDGSSNYFESGAVFHLIAVILALLGTALGIASACLCAKDLPGDTVFSDRINPSPATIGFLMAAVFTLVYCRTTVTPIIGILAAILLFCGAAYSVISGIPSLRQKTNGVVLLGLLTVIGTILLNAYYYFDVSVEMNAPFKLTTQMGLLCATIYLTGEIRFLLGTQKPRLFLALCTTLVSIGSLCSLSLLLAFFLDKTDRGDYVAGALLVFCIMLTAMLRMRNLLPAAPSDNTDETAEVEE